MLKLRDFMRQYLLRGPSDTVNSLSLAAGVAESFTVPAGANCVIFSSTADFFALCNSIAPPTANVAIVPGDITNGSGPELNPIGYELYNIATISVISAAGGIVTAAYYA